MPRTKRVQVLMEPDEFHRLDVIAGGLGLSVGELIRRAVDERWLGGDSQRSAAATAINALALPAISDVDSAIAVGRQGG